MASLGAIRAGRAFVELFADNSKLVRGLRAAESQLKAFGKKVRTFGLKVVGAVSAIFLPIGMYAVKAAADANESASRFQQVFKDQAKAAGEFADALAKAVGRSRYEIRDAMGTFQSFFVGMGFDAGISTVFRMPAIIEHSWDDLRAMAIGQKDISPLYHVTRIVGYFSRIENWNKSKLGELTDRRRGDYAIPGA